MKTSKGKIQKENRPRLTRKQEQFCRICALECWGRPAEAAMKAGYKISPGRLRHLLENPEINRRIRDLRRLQAEQCIADEAWIKEKYIAIVSQSDKSADQLRALTALWDTVAEKRAAAKNTGPEENVRFELDDTGL